MRVLPPPHMPWAPSRLTVGQTDMDGETDGRTETGERHTDPAINRERYKEGETTPDSQGGRSAFREE